jgi:hypothetical protein
LDGAYRYIEGNGRNGTSTISAKTKMEQKGKKEDNSEKKQRKEDITVSASHEEWKDLESLITSYRQQCKAMKHFTAKLERLTRFQQRLTQATGWKSPDDYFI